MSPMMPYQLLENVLRKSAGYRTLFTLKLHRVNMKITNHSCTTKCKIALTYYGKNLIGTQRQIQERT